uniref:cardiotrophin-like cytokine factor 1 isoform X4 n=1 Tax=Panthera onca TaxID=9690 RepID=UPI0029534A20|nr:cardiotrophin-like cytokine factor 1 isoform X4 [Panthera onca]
MSHTEKKKNPKPSEKNLRVGLADGIIKASPEPRLALPLRQPPGEEPRPAGPAPSPMDLRAGDSWGMLACLCAVLWHLPAVPALNRTGDPGPGPSIQKTYDLTRYLEHQLRSLAGTYPHCRALLPSRTPLLGSALFWSTFHLCGLATWVLPAPLPLCSAPWWARSQGLHTRPIGTSSPSISCVFFSSYTSRQPPLPQPPPPCR